MKKTKLFSRIFAAALAAMIAATTLVTNTGAGLLAFATEGGGGNGSSETYSVKIISPDVPADGKTYTYNFYQIIAGNVEDDGGENVLGNAKWGEALGGEAFDNVPEGKTPEGPKYFDDANAGIGYYPSSEVLLAALSGTMSCEWLDINTSGGSYPRGPLLDSAYKGYCKILNSYGVPFTNTTNGFITGETSNYFYLKFKYRLKKDINGVEKWEQDGGKTRDVAGLVELLNDGLKAGKLKTPDLRAFADLLLNGVNVEINLGEGSKEEYTYKFITKEPQAHVDVTSKNGGPYEVTGLKPGYYLVACVGEDNKLSNNGYETSMPVKPVSTMLILVGPANNGVAEIVGKNAYTVPTVTLDMYQKPVELDYEIKTGGTNWNSGTDGGGFDHNVKDIETIIQENNWEKTGSFDYYEAGNRQEAILYRIGITLPQNFDQYKDSGYFLAVLDQYRHYSDKAASSSGEISRVTNVRPYVYVKHTENDKDTYTLVGRYRGNKNDTLDNSLVGYDHGNGSGISNILTNGSNSTYNKYEDLGFNAEDIFCLGDLYIHVKDDKGNTVSSTPKFNLKGGDTIYICYPAILSTKGSYLLNANRVCAIYTNNPYAKELSVANTTYQLGYSHITSGDIGITPIAEANVNTYKVKLTVDGEKGYSTGAKYALYKEMVEGEGENKKTTREYAFTYSYNKDTGHVVRWIPESELQKKVDEELEKENPAFKTIEGALLNYDENRGANGYYAYLSGNQSGVTSDNVIIQGLAAGKYFLQELTISSDGMSSGITEKDKGKDHDNIKIKHYHLAEEPIKFNVGNAYNQNISGYLGVDDNQKTFIEKLTVDFLQDNPERAIDTYIYKPYDKVDEEGNPVPTKNGSVTTTLATTTSEGEDGSKITATAYATEDGEIEIQVYHKTINLIWLPETGGIGTTIFFIVGGTIVLAATVLIVTRFRVKRERL